MTHLNFCDHHRRWMKMRSKKIPEYNSKIWNLNNDPLKLLTPESLLFRLHYTITLSWGSCKPVSNISPSYACNSNTILLKYCSMFSVRSWFSIISLILYQRSVLVVNKSLHTKWDVRKKTYQVDTENARLNIRVFMSCSITKKNLVYDSGLFRYVTSVFG